MAENTTKSETGYMDQLAGLPMVRDSSPLIDVATAAGIVAAAPLALRVALALLADSQVNAFGSPLVSAKVKADIAFKLLDRAGHVAPRALEARSGDIPLHEMSVGELRDLAAQLGAEIADRAKPLNAPIDRPQDAQSVETLM